MFIIHFNKIRGARYFIKLVAMSSDVVAHWNVPLNDGVHKIEFEHGTTTGKRVIRVDDEIIFKKDWMFKLVGCEYFTVGNAKCIIRVITKIFVKNKIMLRMDKMDFFFGY